MIKSYDNEFSKSYADELLENVFVLKNAQAEYSTQFADDGFQVGNTYEWLRDVDTLDIKYSLIIATNMLTNDKIIGNLQNLASKGVNIFLLLADNVANKKCLEALSGCCCIRISMQQSGMLIIADHEHPKNCWGKIYSQNFSDDDFGYSMVLEHKQVEDYYRLFCYLFWHKASDEYLTDKRQSCNNSSIGMIDTVHKHIMPENLVSHLKNSMTKDGVYSFNLKNNKAPMLWQLLDTQIMDFENHELLLSLEQMQSAIAEQLISQAGQIKLFDQPLLPQILFAEKDSWLLPLNIDKKAVNWALKLTENQKQSLENYQFTLQNSLHWKLYRQLEVRDIQSPLRFSDNIENAIECKKLIHRDLGNIECNNYDDFEHKKAEDIVAEKGLINFNRNLLSQNTLFKVTINPPLLPKNASLDSLHKQWQTVQNKWLAELENLKFRQANIEKSKEGLAESIKRYMVSFLKEHINKKTIFEKKLNELTAVDLPKLSPFSRQKMLTSVNELAKKLAESKENLAEEKDKVEQIKKWEEREAKLDSEFISLEQKYKQACSAQENFKSEMPSKLKANEETLLDCWHKWVEDKQNLATKEELSNFSADEIVNWYQKHSKSLDAVFIEKKSQLINKYKKELRKIIEDFNQTKYLITGEENSHKQNVNKHLQKKQRLLEDIEKHKKTKETIKPTNKNSEEKVNMFDLKFPDEELPEVGELFSDKNKRYLSITNREEVTQAKKCAMRLNADLVVSR